MNGFEVQPRHLLAAFPWASYFISKKTMVSFSVMGTPMVAVRSNRVITFVKCVENVPGTQ